MEVENKKRLFGIYNCMLYRCYYNTSYGYRWYGAKGIGVCEEWRNNFEAFYFWAINNGYKDNLTIDRIDNTKGYSPDNCRWATTKEQHKNMSNVKKYTINNETKTMREWCDIYKVDIDLVHNRLKYGWSLEKALTTKARKIKRGKYKLKGKTKTLTSWCEYFNIPYKLVYDRLQYGWTLRRALTTPKQKR